MVAGQTQLLARDRRHDDRDVDDDGWFDCGLGAYWQRRSKDAA